MKYFSMLFFVLLAASAFLPGALAGAAEPRPFVDTDTRKALGATWSKVADEGGSFTVPAGTVVRYGVDTRHITKTLSGAGQCTNSFFGADPALGTFKACFVAPVPMRTTATDPTRVPVPARAAAPTPVQASMPDPVPVARAAVDIVDRTGTVDPAAYRAMALKFGTDEGIAYRYGPSAAEAGITKAGLPMYPKRPDQSMQPVSIQRGWGDRGCGANSWCGEFQIGKLKATSGDFSSSILNFAFIPDDATKHAGAGSLQAISVAHNTYAFRPEPSWTTYAGPDADGGANDQNIQMYRGLQSGSRVGTFPLEGPVAAGKCYGRGGWCTNTLTVFKDGRIVGTGSNTAHNFFQVKLEGKVPTGITITNSGEFALVTVWDTVAIKGQVAVIALGDACQGCDPENEGEWYANWGNAKRIYHGMPGLGNFRSGKMLGYVDLPDSIKAPTEISVSTGKRHEEYEAIRNFWNDNFDSAHNRANYYNGGWTQAIARTGVAVVISKSEKKAAFIDLRPLFMFYREQYFAPKVDFARLVASRGPADTQFPPTFAGSAGQKPVVIKVVDLPAKPTAVKVALQPPHRAYIATQEGKLRVYDLGQYLNPVGGGAPAEVREKFTVDVGKNVTDLTYIKAHGWVDNSIAGQLYPNGNENELIATSRGERKLQWVRFNRARTSGTVARTFQEQRMTDPITTQDADNHGTESYVFSVTDYSGKAVHNWMYGKVIAHTYEKDFICAAANGGCSMLNGGPFEYGGAFAVPGKPFVGVGANIN